jgi:hypothetical protein
MSEYGLGAALPAVPSVHGVEMALPLPGGATASSHVAWRNASWVAFHVCEACERAARKNYLIGLKAWMENPAENELLKKCLAAWRRLLLIEV